MNKTEVHIVALDNSIKNEGRFVIVLETLNREKRLPILIGGFEAQAIAIHLQSIKPNRPLTHDLCKFIIEESQWKVKEVYIHDISGDTFYAQLIGKKSDGEDFSIDGRPSDLIALAIRFACPIYVANNVLDSHSVLVDSAQKSDHKDIDYLMDQTLDTLQEYLDNALAKEDYEAAAKIRDAISKKRKAK